MSLDSPTASSARSASYDNAGRHPVWGEHLVTVVATSLALLIVAVIAVLMGMA